MKLSRSLWIWAALGLCAVLVFGAMTWFTRSVISTEQERAAAEQRADQQENMRLALWRMDSLGTSILLDESLRERDAADSRLPVRTRFEITYGRLSLIGAQGQLDDLRQKLAPDGDVIKAFRSIARMPSPAKVPVPAPIQAPKEVSKYETKDQDLANANEQTVRSKAVEATLERGKAGKKAAPAPAIGADMAEMADMVPAEPPLDGEIAAGNAADDRVGVGEALRQRDSLIGERFWIEPSTQNFGIPRVAWLNGELFLVRRVLGLTGERYDGAWIDQQALNSLLLAEAHDLLPLARLAPATTSSKILTSDGLVLASFPFRLEESTFVNSFPTTPGYLLLAQILELRRTTAVSLLIGWVACILAMATAALLIRGVMRLSERRASFVSAVTHELRTPLTTFRLYSDMLETGAVKEEKRGQYLRVLSREADRLAHLVENVLAFSRIERGSARSVITTTTVEGLLEPMRERFETRLAPVGLSLEIDLTTPAAAALVKVDSAAVEHILFNLIDNAAKYASSGSPPQVEIRIQTARGLEIRVIDHGPGILPKERRRIFHAFHKSAHDAAESKPGVGLGLALSRRLAREMGGSLRYEPQTQGSCFVLSLPG